MAYHLICPTFFSFGPASKDLFREAASKACPEAKKQLKQNELFRCAKAAVSQRGCKSLKSLGHEIGGFRRIVCFQ
jgi:hypothetical protein